MILYIYNKLNSTQPRQEENHDLSLVQSLHQGVPRTLPLLLRQTHLGICPVLPANILAGLFFIFETLKTAKTAKQSRRRLKLLLTAASSSSQPHFLKVYQSRNTSLISEQLNKAK